MRRRKPKSFTNKFIFFFCLINCYCNNLFCQYKLLKPSGIVVNKLIALDKDVSEVEVDNIFKVTIQEAKDTSQAILQVDQSIKDAVSIFNDGKKFIVQLKNKNFLLPANTVLSITISIPDIKSVAVKAANDLTISGEMQQQYIRLNIASVSKSFIHVNCDSLSLTLSSSTEDISGKVNWLSLKSKSCIVHAYKLQAETSLIENTSSTIEVTTNKKLSIVKNKSGEIRYKGNPASLVNLDTNNSSSVYKIEN